MEIALAISYAIGATKAGAIESSVREEKLRWTVLAEQALWPTLLSFSSQQRFKLYFSRSRDTYVVIRQAFSVLKDAGCSDEALCYEMFVLPLNVLIERKKKLIFEYHRWMSKEPA